MLITNRLCYQIWTEFATALFKGQLVIYTKKEITELYDKAVNSSIAIKKCSVSQIPSIYS